MALTIKEKLDQLSVENRRLLRQAKDAHTNMHQSHDSYTVKLRECVRRGITYGMLGEVLGVSRESVHRSAKRDV